MNFELTKSIARHFYFLKKIPVLPIIIDEQIKVYTLFFRPAVFSKMTEITAAIKQFEDVESKYHRYGGLEFRIGQKEFCHIHGDGLLDVILNKDIARQLVNDGVCEGHHVHPDTGWVSYPIKIETDVDKVVTIVRMAYDLRKK